ncbi:MAG: DUF1837 domain-containing protein [Candidatus Babeliaceae bacterium]|nr:DUF1837 domain-containing protein [Candidatus Babeliaceae bacterium]
MPESADIYNSLIPLLRTKPDELNTYIETVCCNVGIDNTRTQAHCHFIALDGNKRPRVKDFARFIGHKITDFAISRSEINRAIKEANDTHSTVPINKLNAKAQSLYTRLPKSGEGGEVLLSVLAETVLRLPQMITKMVLKTSTEMHVHGSDGIHIGVNESNGNLALYWGESKLHEDAAQAVRECFTSLAPFLRDSGGGGAAQERDLQLMRDGIDFDNTQLEEAMKHYLDPDDPMRNQLEYRGLCLVGFDSDAYPTEPNLKEKEEVKQDVEKIFNERKKHIGKRVIEERIHTFEIEIFFLPFPSVDDFRKAFRSELGLSNEQN